MIAVTRPCRHPKWYVNSYRPFLMHRHLTSYARAVNWKWANGTVVSCSILVMWCPLLDSLLFLSCGEWYVYSIHEKSYCFPLFINVVKKAWNLWCLCGRIHHKYFHKLVEIHHKPTPQIRTKLLLKNTTNLVFIPISCGEYHHKFWCLSPTPNHHKWCGVRMWWYSPHMLFSVIRRDLSHLTI